MQETVGRWHKGAVVVALVALLPLLLLEVAIWAGQHASEQRQQAHTRQVAEELRGRLDGEFNAVIYMNRALAAFLLAGRGQVDGRGDHGRLLTFLMPNRRKWFVTSI